MIHVQNPKATIGKYRFLTVADWQAIQDRITPTCSKATITDSKNGREVSFTRAEVEFINQKYGMVRA
jgi:hypothetical protein